MASVSFANRPGFLLSDVARLFRHAFEREIINAGLNITPGEARTLVRISVLEGARQSVIAEQLGIEPMTLCRYLDRLEMAGLIARESDPEDGRAKRIVTTKNAVSVLAAVHATSDRLMEKMQDGLTEQQCKTLQVSLQVMRDNLG